MLNKAESIKNKYMDDNISDNNKNEEVMYEQLRVKKFMKKFGQHCPERPTPLDEETSILRASLVFEEFCEFITKGLGIEMRISPDCNIINSNTYKSVGQSVSFIKKEETNLAELADAVGDLLVTSIGTSVAAGINQKPINEDIFNSNDSKLWIKSDLNKAPEGASIAPVAGGMFVVRREDGKVIKSPKYIPANPQKFIDKQISEGEIEDNQLELF